MDLMLWHLVQFFSLKKTETWANAALKPKIPKGDNTDYCVYCILYSLQSHHIPSYPVVLDLVVPHGVVSYQGSVLFIALWKLVLKWFKDVFAEKVSGSSVVVILGNYDKWAGETWDSWRLMERISCGATENWSCNRNNFWAAKSEMTASVWQESGTILKFRTSRKHRVMVS